MMIISIDETKVIEAAQYASKLCESKEHKCKACPDEYNKILLSFRRMINHQDDEVLICVNENKILGVLALLVEPDNKYLEAVGGVYAKENYQEIAIKFYKYIKEKYTGYKFDAVYPEENIEAIYFMESIDTKLISSDLEMKLKKDDFHLSNSNNSSVPLSKKYYGSFCRFHDEYNENVYWTGNRLLLALDKFDISITIDKEEVIGEIVTSVYENGKKEIYFLNVDKNHQGYEHDKSLLENCIHKSSLSNIKEIMVLVEKNDTNSINLYKSFGFHKSDTVITYSINSL